ncbi:hypothetical protein ABZ714_19580 [Streptomyces sp. NPDC006798]|uniref:hypothetical protein n=1 Tax=Streptomyces sp. NPDC006798 TaxID=3155462 RepID=UPI0033F459D4
MTATLVGFVLGIAVLAAAVRLHDRTARRRTARAAEQAARPHTQPADVPALVLAAACCEIWWTSAGTDHEPTCHHKEP